uniref:Sulfotransferase domain-containing protein n=1 Tax=Strigamia maritima TaxID=126957 RepID=T1IQ75_STRMM
MKLRVMASACRYRVLAVGATVSCLYFFILELIVSRHLDLMNGETQPSKYLDETKKSAPTPVTMATRNGNGRMLGRRLSHQRVMVLCSNMSFQRPPGPVTALASFPGSGNTWIRYLLQQATGVYTGSIYTDYALLRHGFPAENVVNGSVLLVKTHEWGIHIRQNFSRAVLIVRDPVPAILAEFNRQGGGHIGHASIDKYRNKEGKLWKAFVSGKSRSWLET